MTNENSSFNLTVVGGAIAVFPKIMCRFCRRYETAENPIEMDLESVSLNNIKNFIVQRLLPIPPDPNKGWDSSDPDSIYTTLICPKCKQDIIEEKLNRQEPG